MSPVDDQLIEKLSELSKEDLVRELVHAAGVADRTSREQHLHFRFRPDDKALSVGIPHLLERGYGTSVDPEDGTIRNEYQSLVPQLPTLTFDPSLSHLHGEGTLHRLLIGDNYHALVGLQAHAAVSDLDGAYDLIYIDPPYNTGHDDLTYNDTYVNLDDPWRHTKFLSFLEPRLVLAQRLLKDTGVIFISIGNDELASTKLVCNSVFGRGNALSILVWNGTTRKNDSRFVSNGADYILVYAKNKGELIYRDIAWMERKPGIDEMHAASVRCWKESDEDTVEASKLYRAWQRSLPKGHPAALGGLKPYSRVDVGGRLYRTTDVSFPNGTGPKYPVLHPTTGLPVKVPASGWRCSESTMAEWISNDRVAFGANETTVPQYKRYLDEHEDQKAISVFTENKSKSANHVEDILGPKVFTYPKDHGVLAKWIEMAAPKNAKILDFFAGSGSTLEAALSLNAADGGTREVTLVTNDDEGIGTRICRERAVRVMTGEGWADGKLRDGYGGQLAVFRVGTADAPPPRPVYESEGHTWTEQAGVWAAWFETPLLVERTDEFLRFADASDEKCSVVFHDIDTIDEDIVDDLIEKYPHARMFIPFNQTGTYRDFYVIDVPDAVAIPKDVLGPVSNAVRESMTGPYTRRGVTHMDRLRTLVSHPDK